MATIQKTFVLTITEDEAKGLRSVLRDGISYSTACDLGIEDVVSLLNVVLDWTAPADWAVQATPKADADALQALRDKLAE